jgi:hypothetical protein
MRNADVGDDFADRRRKAAAARGERRLRSECSILMRL